MAAAHHAMAVALLEQSMTDDIKAIRDTLDDDELRELRTAADCAGLSQEFARLLDALEAATRDAERYRAMRDPNCLKWLLAVFDMRDPMNKGKPLPFECVGAKLDSAIDAALKRGAYGADSRSTMRQVEGWYPPPSPGIGLTAPNPAYP
jgi:hypothetical protein